VAREGTREEQVAILFDRHYRSLRGLAFTLLGDSGHAEEVTADAFVKAFSGWNRFRTVQDPHAYLRQMVVNLCRARLRRAKIESRVNASVHREERSLPVDTQPDRIDLWTEIRRLPARQRACVVLRYSEDLPEHQIADLLGCSVGTVKSQLSKARAKLAAALGEGRKTSDE
jgi:RNA polymerase sigma-70 factor (sigma-E family)